MTSNATKPDQPLLEGPPPKRPYVANHGNSMSVDSAEAKYGPRESYMKYPPRMPPSPHRHQLPHGGMGYSHQYHAQANSRPSSRPLQSVITASFSIEEEREQMMSAGRGQMMEQRFENEEGRQDAEEREDWGSSRPENRQYYNHQAPSFTGPIQMKGDYREANSPLSYQNRSKGMMPQMKPPYIQRSYSSTGYFPPPNDSLKRSYYHHSRPVTQYPGQLPPDFLPPKKPKLEASSVTRKEVVVSAKDGESGPWTLPTKANFVHRSQSFPAPPSWNGSHFQPGSPHIPHHGNNYHPEYVQISPAREIEASPRAWQIPNQWGAVSPARHSGVQFWESPRNRDSMESPRGWGPPPRNHIGTRREIETQRIVSYRDGSELRSRMMKAEMSTESQESAENIECKGGIMTTEISGKPILLLALPQDRVALSETLCVVRENIEVFTATQSDVDAPAPGRKHAVVVGQVGLRCIHCRHTTRCSDRVKRAVCYPSSIKRIYRTVIDMKLDHFSQCKYVPIALKNRLDELKAIHTRSTGTTMTYFCNAARMLGMEDTSNGVVLREKALQIPSEISHPVESKKGSTCKVDSASSMEVTRTDSLSSSSWVNPMVERSPPRRTDSMSTESIDSTPSHGNQTLASVPEHNFEGLIPLALPEDKTALSPLRCFLREQVCAFSATEKDIAVRAPTTFSIAVGQVGIGCIHCVKQAARLRSNRAVCFPFSIGRIYQSVADIQRFHFQDCKNMPTSVKDKFLELQSASSKGSKGLATRQYWVTSAKKIGLIDTPQGIRFGRDPSKPEASKSFSLDILAQVAFSVTTQSKQLVLSEDKPCIAEFLYVVMEQLQPCRFTEADRNKRRLKDVGCIGVECKHCAGQVDSRKFFWSSVSAVESNFVSVHTHMLECRMVPTSLKEKLSELKKLRKEQTAALKTGSQKAFFARVWRRLHDEEVASGNIMVAEPSPSEEMQQELPEEVPAEEEPPRQRNDDPATEEGVNNPVDTCDVNSDTPMVSV